MQQEQEAGENAPLGFKNYDAGDYRVFVPSPYSLAGRDKLQSLCEKVITSVRLRR
jgi:hypothetical protein